MNRLENSLLCTFEVQIEALHKPIPSLLLLTFSVVQQPTEISVTCLNWAHLDRVNEEPSAFLAIRSTENELSLKIESLGPVSCSLDWLFSSRGLDLTWDSCFYLTNIFCKL